MARSQSELSVMIIDQYFTQKGFVTSTDHGLQFFTNRGAFVSARPPVPVPLWTNEYTVPSEVREFEVLEIRDYIIPIENRSS